MTRSPLPILLAATVALSACEEPVPGEDWESDGFFAVMGALVFTSPHADPIEDGVVIVLDGAVEAVGQRGQVQVPGGARRVDASGLSLLPGFWNADVWVDDEVLSLAESGTDEELSAALRERFTRYGFTTIVETGSSAEELRPLLDRLDGDSLRGPRVLALAGRTPPGIHHGGWWYGMEGEAVDLGGIPSGDVALVPSLSLAGFPGEGEAPEATAERLDDALAAVTAYVETGGPLVFGTGAGYVPDFDPAAEFQLLDEAGVSFVQLLAALTEEPALRFGQDYTGVVQQGMLADLTLVEGDPSSDPTALTRVRWVIREGRTVFSAMR